MKRAFRHVAVPLAFYYAITVALPLANGAAGPAFWKHALIVLILPLVLVALFCMVRAAVLWPFRRKPV